MKPNIEDNVSKIMTKQPVCLTSDVSVEYAKVVMYKHCIRHIPVVDDKKLVGILSKTDLDKVQQIDEIAKSKMTYDMREIMNVSNVMTKSINTVQHDDTIKDAAEILSLGSYHALPVMSGDDVVGIVTTTDLVIYLLKFYE